MIILWKLKRVERWIDGVEVTVIVQVSIHESGWHTLKGAKMTREAS
jgi:hypothetical protein